MDNPVSGVMTLTETSQYLRIPVSTLYKLAQESKVPCQKVGRHWRFRREALDRWLDGMSLAGMAAVELRSESQGE